MRRPARLPALTGLLALAWSVTAAPARADDAADARALFEQARALAKAGNHAEACPLFERSLALEAALGTELNLALCLAATGKLVAAARMFEALVDKTTAPDQAKRHDIAVQGAATLAARIPTLRLQLGDGVTGATIDGEPVEAGVAVALDPGRHVLEADGAARQVVELVEGERRDLALAPVATAAPVERPDPGPAPARSRLRWVLGGAGAGAVVASAVTGLVVLRRREAGLDRCEDQAGMLVCDPVGAAQLDRARTYSHLSTGLFVVGAGLIATAVVLHLRGEPADRPRHAQPARRTGAGTAMRVDGWIGPGGAGLGLGAAW